MVASYHTHLLYAHLYLATLLLPTTLLTHAALLTHPPTRRSHVQDDMFYVPHTDLLRLVSACLHDYLLRGMVQSGVRAGFSPVSHCNNKHLAVKYCNKARSKCKSK